MLFTQKTEKERKSKKIDSKFITIVLNRVGQKMIIWNDCTSLLTLKSNF